MDLYIILSRSNTHTDQADNRQKVFISLVDKDLQSV